MKGIFNGLVRLGIIVVGGILIGISLANLTQKKNLNLVNPQSGVEKIFTTIVLKDTPSPTPTAKKVQATRSKTIGDTGPWGVARQIDEHTWTMKVGMDARMATPQEILSALNTYRGRYGSQPLTWDNNLAGFAQNRASYLYSIKSTDGHKGFADFLENQDGYSKLDFNWLGENISYGYQLEGVHLIEWMYAGDKPHDDNQKDSKWDHVGIGVKGTATCLIFGTGKR